jgi:hypothetical protein
MWHRALLTIKVSQLKNSYEGMGAVWNPALLCAALIFRTASVEYSTALIFRAASGSARLPPPIRPPWAVAVNCGAGRTEDGSAMPLAHKTLLWIELERNGPTRTVQKSRISARII